MRVSSASMYPQDMNFPTLRFTRPAGSFTGRARNSRAWAMLKMAVFAPMPSASKTTIRAQTVRLPRRLRMV